MEIWLIRHGETEWSREGRHTGRTDLPLLPEGEDQATTLGRRLAGHPFVRVLTSPMRRARRTAELAGFGGRGEVTDLLAEIGYGEFEGRTTKDIQEEWPGWELFVHGCPGGEALEEVAARMDRLLRLIEAPDGDVLLFGHGHCLRALAVRYVGLDVEAAGLLRLSAGGLSVLGTEHGHPAVSLWNETHPAGQ